MSSSSRRPEDIGGMGEGFFRMIAKAAGLVVNQAREDRAAWDFVVEIPSPLEVNFDSQSRPQYRIQVKSTSGDASTTALTYSSLLSLIQHGGPAFVLCLQFSSGDTPASAALLHLGEPETLEILTALRRKKVRKPDLKINQSKHTLAFPPEAALRPLNGATLRGRLESYLPHGQLRYIELKTAWLRKLETDAQQLFANIRVEGEQNVRGMAESFLGFETPFTMASKSYKAPMGIPAEDVTPTTEHPGGIRPIESQLPAGKLTLRATPYGAKYEFGVRLYTVPKHLPEEVWAMRLRTALFSIVMRLSDRGMSFVTEDLAGATLQVAARELRNLLAFAAEASEVGCQPSFDFRLNSGGLPLAMALQMPAEALEGLTDLHKLFEPIYQRLANLGLADEMIAPAALWRMSDRLELVAHAGRAFGAPWEFEFDARAKRQLDASAVIFLVHLKTASTEVIFHVALTGKLERVGTDRFKGTFTGSLDLPAVLIPNSKRGERVQILKSHGDRLISILAARGLRVLESPDENDGQVQRR